ncbi:MAG: diadenylate cyclase CdaA [Clostridia bacterium]
MLNNLIVLPQNMGALLLTLLDISLVAFGFYFAIRWLEGTRAVQLIKGLALVVVIYVLSSLLGLRTINWLLDQVRIGIVVALPVVFQPELRRMLERLGRQRFFSKSLDDFSEQNVRKVIREISQAAGQLAQQKIGALIVLERQTGLQDYIDTGIKINATISNELIANIFIPNTPLHDGAMIMRGGRIEAVGCFLPLTDNGYLSKQLGTRHRAAIGITEVSDAIAVVISEETGVISVSDEGILTRYLDSKSLREMLEAILIKPSRMKKRNLGGKP